MKPPKARAPRGRGRSPRAVRPAAPVEEAPSTDEVESPAAMSTEDSPDGHSGEAPPELRQDAHSEAASDLPLEQSGDSASSSPESQLPESTVADQETQDGGAMAEPTSDSGSVISAAQPVSEADRGEETEEMPRRHAEDEEAESGRTAGDRMQLLFEDLIRTMGVQGTVRVRDDNDDQVTLDILNCPDASLIIGRHGQTVDDLQYLGSLILNHNRRQRKRFLLNVENYRERREEILRSSAIALARQVAEARQEAVLDPLPPHERRIIHMALLEVPEVYTYSEGVEPDRRIVISPRELFDEEEDEGEEDDETGADFEEEVVVVASFEAGDETLSAVSVEEAGVNDADAHEQDALRDAAEFGLTAPGGEGESPSGDVPEPVDAGAELPETTPGGGEHGAGHTGLEPGE